MNAFNWLLINGANALWWLWGAIQSLCVFSWSAVDSVLNPILSPVLSFLNPICTKIGDVGYALLGPCPAWLSLAFLSILTGVLALVVFRYTSNPAKIGRALDDIKANLLALKLFKDEMRVTFMAQLRLFWAVARLQRYMLAPMLVMLPPMLLVLAQMGLRHQWRPLEPDELTLVKLTQRDAATPLAQVALEPNEGAVVEVGPIPGGGEWVWRIRGGEPGRHVLRFRVDDRVIEKELVVGSGFQRVSAIRVGSHWTTQLLHPAERRLETDAPVASIEILYSGVDSWIHGADYWVLTFFVISMLAALALKPLFKVRF